MEITVSLLLFCTLIVGDCTESAILPKAFNHIRRHTDFHFSDSNMPEKSQIDSSMSNQKFPVIENGPRFRLFEKRSSNNKNEDKVQDFISYNDIDSSDPFPYKFLEGSGGNDQEVSQETQDYLNDGINENYDENIDTLLEDGKGIQDYKDDYDYQDIDESLDDYMYATESPDDTENDWRYYYESSGDCSDENEHAESNSLDNMKEINGEGSDNKERGSVKSGNDKYRTENEHGHKETEHSYNDSTSAIVHNKKIQSNKNAETRIFSENFNSDKADSGNGLIYIIVGSICGVLGLVFFLVLPALLYRRYRRKRLNESGVYNDSRKNHQMEEGNGLLSKNAHLIYKPGMRSTDSVMDSANKILQDEERQESSI